MFGGWLAFRHAKANSVSIHLVVSDEAAVLKVTDDGQGFVIDNVMDNPGMGLGNMRRRVHDMGSTLLIQSVLGQGTELEFRLPVNRSATVAQPPNPQSQWPGEEP